MHRSPLSYRLSRRAICVCFCAITFLGLRLPTEAEEFEWIGDQNEITPGFIPPGWAFTSRVFWQGLKYPGDPDFISHLDEDNSNDDAIFGGGYVPVGSPFPYRFGNGGTVFFGDFGSVHAPLKGGPTLEQEVHAVNRNVSVQSGEWTFNFNAYAYPTSLMTPDRTDSGSYTISDFLNVGGLVKATGEAGTATLNVVNSGLTTRQTQIGRGSVGNSPVVGTLDVSGADTIWQNNEDFTVGHDNGQGNLVVREDATASARHATIGLAGGDGAAFIYGSSNLNLSGSLTIGASGKGWLGVASLSTVLTSDGTIGLESGSVGSLDLFEGGLLSDGPNMADFEVGFHGNATMNLTQSSAYVMNGSIFVGRGKGSTATVNVDGASFLGTNGNFVIAAGEGSGDSPSNGTVNVAYGSSLEVAQSLLVGEKGVGALHVLGSDVVSRIGRIGIADGSVGDVSLDGGSRWTIAENLFVGEGGSATLTVSGRSLVQVNSLLQVGNGGVINFLSSEYESGQGSINIGGGFPSSSGILRVGEGGILAGGGIINGSVLVDGGSLSPGFSPGILSINGDLNIASLGSLSIEIGGEIPGVDYDVLDVTGNIDIDGTIFVTLIDGYRPGRGDVFDLFRFGGDFDPLSLSQIVFTNAPSGLYYELALSAGVASVVVTVPEVGSLSFLGVASVIFGLAVRYRRNHA